MPEVRHIVSAEINPITREILFTKANESIVEFDTGILTIEFKMPKNFGQFDPENKPFDPENYAVDVNYTQADPAFGNGPGYTSEINENAFFYDQDEPDYVFFTWSPGSSAALVDGWLWFSVKIFDTEGGMWATKAKKVRVWPAVSGSAHDDSNDDKSRARYCVLYIPQTLNAGQKAQARSNIGITENAQGMLSGKNLVDSYSAANSTTGLRINVIADGENAIILSRDNPVVESQAISNRNIPVDYSIPFFQIKLKNDLARNTYYVLSFDCIGADDIIGGLPDYVLMCNSENGKHAQDDDVVIVSESFEICDGRNVVLFRPSCNIIDHLWFHEAPVSGSNVHNWTYRTSRPEETSRVNIWNIQIEAGTEATDYEPSSEAIFERAKEAAELTHTYIEQSTTEGWAVAEFEGVHYAATTPWVYENVHLLSSDEKFAEWGNRTADGYSYDFRISEILYAALPFPARYSSIHGNADRGALNICNVNGIGARAAIAIKFRLTSPYYKDNMDISRVVLRFFAADRRHVVQASPDFLYDESKAGEIVTCARSYTDSYDAGRRYVYGANIFYGENPDNPRKSNGRITDENGYAIMECDTFVGMVLRGIDYDHSPYNPSYNSPHTSSGWIFHEGVAGGWKQVKIVSSLPQNGDGYEENDVVGVNNNNSINYYILQSSHWVSYSSSNIHDGWYYIASTPGYWTSNGLQEGPDDNNPELNKRVVGINGNTGYEQLMIDTENSVPVWAQKLREVMTSDIAHKCYNRDLKYACDYAWLFWSITKEITESIGGEEVSKTLGCVFSDSSKAMPGDVAFMRVPDRGRWFDNISHCVIVTEGPDADGYLTIAEITGTTESGGRILQEVNMRYRNQEIAYFARPYGWY